MSGIRVYDDITRFDLPKSDASLFSVVKTKQGWSCQKCGKQIPYKSWALGRGYRKVCLSCATKFLNDIKTEFQKIVNNIQKTEDDLIENKAKYNDDNLLANLGEKSVKNGNL